MDFTLDQLLTIVGRLDDSPGFDVPRERFRRFLQDRLATVEPARLLIQHCRQQSGEQSHRALQDVVALFGRFLGFETAFRPYQHPPGELPVHATWQVRHRLHITLILCTDQTPDLDLEAVSTEMAAGDGHTPRVCLIVLTPLYPGGDRVRRALAAGEHPHVRVAMLDGLLRLAALVENRQLTSDDVLEVFNPAASVDARVDLLERVTRTGHAENPEAVAATVPDVDQRERRYWINAMRAEPFTPTDRTLRSLIGTHQILGINPAPGLEDRVRVGDAICVFIAGRGIVAHGTIAGILGDGSRIIRDSKRFTHVLRLTGVTVYDTPAMPNQELARKLQSALTDECDAVTVSIAPREFESMTAHALSQAG